MTDPLSVDPDGLRKIAQDLQDVSTTLKQVYSSLTDKLAAEGSPWGNDQIGDQFANGDSGYLAQKEWVSNSIDGKTQLLDSYADSFMSAANDFEGNDR
ncbi:hypothetical protein A5624_13065 [Mycobacterium sp. 1482292.6]|uniref:hypothetical protein n=1 Tax=unclassified Mycobacterium TaxID=2642494 RepID=UPI0007FCBB04|nr:MULTISPECIES: hypothetical protein [unclassified Mycobacterium]OBJ11681.1 hypothetical protein A5624_13065 [Mycobacterium sp. 1482292.6]OBJ16207.1 hypothetical protein A5622_25755 [Mycobacterium sp. 1245801.1]